MTVTDCTWRSPTTVVGFNPEQTGVGTGLSGMADRLVALGGQLTVAAQPGRGTAVTGWAPLPT